MCVASRPLAACSVVRADQVHPGSFPWCNETERSRTLERRAMRRADCFLSRTEQGSATSRSGRFDNWMRAEGASNLGGDWRLGSYGTHVANAAQFFQRVRGRTSGDENAHCPRGTHVASYVVDNK